MSFFRPNLYILPTSMTREVMALQQQAELYFKAGKAAGLTEDRLFSILAEENLRSRASAEISAADALENAHRRISAQATEQANQSIG